jgi:halocyanin-like protein
MDQSGISSTVSRRAFITSIGGTAGGVAVAGEASAQSGGNKSGGGGGGPIDYKGWLEGVPYWGGPGSTKDMTGKKKVTIKVGGNPNNYLSFQPAAVHIDPGTTVVWKWTGKGGAHNVVGKQGGFKSGSPVATKGHTFKHTFKKNGVNNYYCQPHRSLGMKGSIAVGKVPHKSAAVAQKVEPHEMGVPLQAHYVGIATVLMMVTSIVFTFYTLKYGTSAHTKGGNN